MADQAKTKKDPKLLIEISKSTDGYKYAYCPVLRLFGSGHNFHLAIRDMLLTARDLLAEYKAAGPGELHSSAKLELRKLSRYEATIRSLLEPRRYG